MFCSKEPLLKLGDRSWSGVRERDLGGVEAQTGNGKPECQTNVL